MKLNPGERSILATFPNDNKAVTAKEEIRKMGIEAVQVDRISRYGVSHNDQINNPIAGRAETGTGLTLHARNEDPFVNNDTRVLLGADPSNSGIGDDNYGVAGGHAFLLTVVTSEEKVDQVVQIIKQHNGRV